MAHAENELLINKPVSEIFSFLCDGLNNPKWRSGIVDIKLKSGEVGKVGTVYQQVLKGPGGKNLNGDYKLTVVEPNKELSFDVITGPARPTGSYILESLSGGTKVRFILDFQPKGLARLMGPMIQKTMMTEVSQLSELKRVLEK